MKRIIILEKVGDLFRQYWKLPELDYPESPQILDKIIERLINQNYIELVKYDKEADIRVIPWIWNEGIIDRETKKYRPGYKVFPFPKFDIRSEQELDQYNLWLKTEFRNTIIKLNNCVHLEPGWENIKPDQVIELNPVEVNITQEDLDKLELFSSMLENGGLD